MDDTDRQGSETAQLDLLARLVAGRLEQPWGQVLPSGAESGPAEIPLTDLIAELDALAA